MVNIGKTESMCIEDEQEDVEVEDGVFFLNWQQYRYLGVKIVQDEPMDQNIQSRKARAMFNSFLWDRQIRKENKKLMYNTIVKSIMTYSREILPLKQKTREHAPGN